MKERNVNLDLIRCLAVFLVISVHFLLNNGFYSNEMIGEKMFILTMIRTYSMICVPLFLLLTGYLMNKKKVEKGYYKGIIRILIIYVIVSIICLIFKKFYYNYDINIKNGRIGILDFTAANYSWYIEMYIGLFLLIPFLNIMYNNIDSKENKIKLILTFLTLTTLPSILNIYKITGESNYNNLVPDWWINLYPITYYFIGAFLCEYKEKIKINKWLNIIFIIVTILISTIFNYTRSYGNVFEKGEYVQFYSLENVLLSILVFILINNLNFEKVPKIIKSLIVKTSKLSLGIYLISWIFDKIFYKKLNLEIVKMTDKLYYYIPIVLAVLICSYISSIFINIIADFIVNLIYKNKMKNKRTI